MRSIWTHRSSMWFGRKDRTMSSHLSFRKKKPAEENEDYLKSILVSMTNQRLAKEIASLADSLKDEGTELQTGCGFGRSFVIVELEGEPIFIDIKSVKK